MKWTSSAPANLMLMGEHSVVYGHKAIACSLNHRISIDWSTRDDNQIRIYSTLGNHCTDTETLAEHPSLKWVMACLQHYQPQLTSGLNIQIESDFSSTVGLGSSAAVLAATLGGLNHFTQQNASLETLFDIGLNLIHSIQGRGSGTDLAASLHGGIILFDPQNQSIQKLTSDFPISLVYCGYKTPTAKVLEKVATDWQDQPALLQHLYQMMGQTTEAAYQSLRHYDINAFYRLANTYQGLMDALGVNDATLSHLVYQLRHDREIHASKISGSGLGDCVIGFGIMQPQTLPNYERIIVHISTHGLNVTPN
ncbi:GHMP kinase [Hydrogenovibrio sp. 3SP14C1]|uniref:mevalonate kinase family protein n=1 Tax=Hydrogenovibrio sp. 3SP14C1 TaxID=3038774 RepID=UPI002417AE68|nr:GHMP kinase [Hydrogenovibrio sp. 3SP14C1]MDG4812304.1 GHMP kinase [Hydrogenovibrio sp. 3SP14C1]